MGRGQAGKKREKPLDTPRPRTEDTPRPASTDLASMTAGDVQRLVHALQESEERFRRMADHAPVMIWMSGVDRLCTWLNKPWADFTGRAVDEDLGEGWMEGIHPEDRARCEDTYATAFDARQSLTLEYRIRRHDGQWRWVLDTGAPLHQEDGAFAGYIGSCIDVTDRKQSEEALRQSEDRMRAILNTADDAIITIDRDGIILSVNPATERIFGYAAHELLGQNVRMLMPPPHHDDHDRYIQSYLETGEARIIGVGREVEGRRKDQTRFPIDLAISAIEHLGLFTGVIRDISRRKQTERELDQYRKDLQAMASELMLAEERERQRLAQDLHDGPGQALFRARMKLDQAATDDPVIREIDTILDDLGQMLNTLTFELSPPVLHQLGLRPAIEWLSRDLKQRYNLSIHVDHDGEPLPLDERVAVVVFRAVRELLINVAKHAHTDSAGISVLRSGDRVQIEVEDRGRGFDLTAQARQVEAGRFGLFSIRERLEYVSGTFKIQSAPGKGTRVTLTAPLATATD